MAIMISIPAGVLANQETANNLATNHTERMLLLKDGKIVKEKEGLHLAKKNNKCPHCGSSIKMNDDTCPSCKKPIFSSDELFST